MSEANSDQAVLAGIGAGPMILPNTFRERLAAGHPTPGTHFMFTDPDIPELIGDTGLFDYGEFSAE